MDKSPTHGKRPRQLAKLLAIGGDASLNADAPAEGLTAGDVLRERLKEAFFHSGNTTGSGPAGSTGRCFAPRPCDLLVDRESDPAVLQALKNHAKMLARVATAESERDAATVLYYAAIANALVYHQQKITGHPYRTLADGFAKLAQEPWIPTVLRDLLSRARDLCRGSAK